MAVFLSFIFIQKLLKNMQTRFDLFHTMYYNMHVSAREQGNVKISGGG